MNVVFVCRGAESLGVEYLSSVLKEHGHQTALAFDPGLFGDKRYLNVSFLKRLLDSRVQLCQKIRSLEPDLVAFTVVTDFYRWACQVARWVKENLNVPVVFGGIHPTSLPHRVLDNNSVDFVIRGEGEYALLELVSSLEKGKVDTNIQNLCFRKNGEAVVNPLRSLLENLDELPFPDKSLFERDIPIGPTY